MSGKEAIKRGLSVIFMLAAVGAVLFLLASGPYTANHSYCSAKSCAIQKMHQ